VKKISYLLIIFASLFIYSCTSYKKSVYLRGIENNGEYKLYDSINSYKLKKGDIIFIEINSLNDNLNSTFNVKSSVNTTYNEAYLYIRSYSINENGLISLPIIGDLKLEGFTLAEAKETIQKSINNYLNDATVIVKFVSFNFSVLGEVNNPGQYSVYKNKMSILDAISIAGNVGTYGNIKNVLLIRNSENKVKTYRINLTDRNLLTSELYYIQPNDVIYVEPVKAKVFRQNAPNISVALTSITTLIVVLNFILK
jgi:polysaccharide export outer membrane protein